MINEELNEREKNVLRYIVQQFVLTASPVGSRILTKKYDMGISPATVRNIMSDLEDSGFINHPHTSAGRIPTDKGYRMYVDALMDIQKLSQTEKHQINRQLETNFNDSDDLLNITARLLSSITNQLACVLYPSFDSGILEKIQLIILTSNRMMAVLSIRSGLVKTITLELSYSISENQLLQIQQILNERLAGLKLSEIRSTVRERLKDIPIDDKPMLTLFIDSADKIFKDIKSESKVLITGAKNLMKQPEFESHERMQGIVELMEEKDIIIHFFEKKNESSNQNVFITIGSENQLDKLDEYSLVTKEYKIGDLVGTLGVVGPKRMEYSKIVAIVDYISKMLSDFLTKT
ncbi:MAG: heat-inducible transcriptional repressor HrcA [Ignavibacteria bacterium]|jgi:heat-inducible transcriptional repressor|nr:heat-inducible transcriptional repressor HrcA [Ignavibacteria bacterium]